MKKQYFLAKDRGHISTGWLSSYYSFNFETMEEFEKIRFGQLRILNNDTITGSSGFGSHGHANMEIVTIPLEGGLIHKDSLGNSHKIVPGDVQLMTAGTGIVHSEYNFYDSQQTNFLQIWVFPSAQNLEPRYDQHFFETDLMTNKWHTMVAPGNQAPLYINQSAYFTRALLDQKQEIDYEIHQPGNGVLFYVIKGKAYIHDEEFKAGDAIGFPEVNELTLKTNGPADILAIEVPMKTK